MTSSLIWRHRWYDVIADMIPAWPTCLLDASATRWLQVLLDVTDMSIFSKILFAAVKVGPTDIKSLSDLNLTPPWLNTAKAAFHRRCVCACRRLAFGGRRCTENTDRLLVQANEAAARGNWVRRGKYRREEEMSTSVIAPLHEQMHQRRGGDAEMMVVWGFLCVLLHVAIWHTHTAWGRVWGRGRD